jgi:hypothetical protein
LAKEKYQHFEDLPPHIRTWMLRRVSPHDPERWCKSPIPALGHESMLEVMNGENGERRVVEYLNRLPDGADSA